MAQRYFALTQEIYVPGAWILLSPVNRQGQELRSVFNRGETVMVEGPLHLPLCQTGIPLDYSEAATESVPIVSARLAALFTENAPQDIQLIPVKVDGQREPYFVLNVIRVIKCIDEQTSEEVRHRRKPKDGMPRAEGYELVTGMRIDPSLVGKAQVFRTWGWEDTLVVSEPLKNALERLKATGLKFEEVTGSSPISDVARARRDRRRQLLEESRAFGDAVWQTLGTWESARSYLNIPGGAGPANYQAWRIIQRPQGRCLLVSQFLSAPFIERMEPSVGHGLELMLETDVDVQEARDPWKTWPLKVLQSVSQQVVESVEVREEVKSHLCFLELPGKGLPRFLHTSQSKVGVLIGVLARSLPSSYSTPYGEVKLMTIKALLPEEVAYIEEQGVSASNELARRFVESGEEHLSLSRRRSVV